MTNAKVPKKIPIKRNIRNLGSWGCHSPMPGRALLSVLNASEGPEGRGIWVPLNESEPNSGGGVLHTQLAWKSCCHPRGAVEIHFSPGNET